MHEKEVVGLLHALGVRKVDLGKGERSSVLCRYFDDAFVSIDCGLHDEENTFPSPACALPVIKDRTEWV